MAMKFNRNFSIGRVVKRLVYTILALYVGGQVITEFGTAMNGTESPFYRGLTLIGWTVGDWPEWNSTHHAIDCAATAVGAIDASHVDRTTCITATNGSGVLAVVGIIGIAGVVMEFVSF